MGLKILSTHEAVSLATGIPVLYNGFWQSVNASLGTAGRVKNDC